MNLLAFDTCFAASSVALRIVRDGEVRQAVRFETMAQGHAERLRITSYNVCYTKLLRLPGLITTPRTPSSPASRTVSVKRSSEYARISGVVLAMLMSMFGRLRVVSWRPCSSRNNFV